MKTRRSVPAAGLLFICSGLLYALPHGERALWIEVKENGEPKTTIAVTEAIAREFLESDAKETPFGKKGKNGKDELITKEMVRSVLDGTEESVEARDDNGSEAKLYMSDLNIPDHRRGTDKLVLETYKSGTRTFRLALPGIEMESADGENGGTDVIDMRIGWKGLLPFLAKEGGAIYISTAKDDTEVWLYVD